MCQRFRASGVLFAAMLLCFVAPPATAHPAHEAEAANLVDVFGTVDGITDFAEYDVPTSDSRPGGIVVGPDGSVWFIESLGNNLGRIASDGQITEFPIPTPSANPPNQAFVGIGPDGMVWFTESAANKIGRITPDGEITEFDIRSAADLQDSALGTVHTSFPIAIAAGSDGAVWFNKRQTN